MVNELTATATKKAPKARVRTNEDGSYTVIGTSGQELSTWESLYLAKRSVHVINSNLGR
jgi:hypothetical protein